MCDLFFLCWDLLFSLDLVLVDIWLFGSLVNVSLFSCSVSGKAEEREREKKEQYFSPTSSSGLVPMEGCSRKDEVCPQLLDLISKDREWVLKRGEGRSHGSPEEKKLELRLGPPGEDWTIKDNSREREESFRYFRYLSSMTQNCNNNNNNGSIMNNTTTTSCGKRGFQETVERNTGDEGWIMSSNGNQNQQQGAGNNNNNGVPASPWSPSGYQVKTQQQQPQTKASFLEFQSSPTVITKESPQTCCTKVVDLQNTEKKAFSPAPANTAVPNSSQKRYPQLFYFFKIYLTEDIHLQCHCFISFAVVHA